MTDSVDAGRVSRFIDRDGVRLHVLDWGGDGPPLLLLHGGRRTSRSWNAVARRLHDSFRVIALDVRGHGDSGASERGNDSRGRMGDIACIAEGLELSPHYVMAHSLGCAPAGLYASHCAERVRGLILIEPVIDVHYHWTGGGGATPKEAFMEGSERRNGWRSLDELRSRLERSRATRNWAPEVLEDILREETFIHPDNYVEIKWHSSVYNLDEMWNDRTSLIHEAPRMTMPTLILVRTDNDQMESHLKPLAQALPSGRLEAIPNVGHAIYMENPDLTAKYAREFFLGRIDGA